MIQVSVTPETEQSVIATLARPGSYYRQVTVEYPERGGRLTSEQWVDGGWSKSDTVLPGGMVRHSIVRRLYALLLVWEQPELGSALRRMNALPTWRGPISPPMRMCWRRNAAPSWRPAMWRKTAWPASMWRWSIRSWTACPGPTWVAVENGLLTAAEQCKGDTLVLSMTAAAAERPVAAGTVFALPDGTRLHTVAET